jgi:hypothetical protein
MISHYYIATDLSWTTDLTTDLSDSVDGAINIGIGALGLLLFVSAARFLLTGR